MDPGFLAVLQPAVAQAALEEHQENIASGAPPPKEKYKVGDVLKGESTRLVIVEGKTQPPTHLTESSLITMMEKNGIGTDASIPTHIENIVKRKYVSLAPGRKLVPTALGIVLIKGYLRVDPDLVQPRVRAAIENRCDLIAQGLAKKHDVVAHALRNFEKKFVFYDTHIERVDELFALSFSEDISGSDSKENKFSRCGLTGRYLRYIDGIPPKLYEKGTETIYALPVGGRVRTWSGRRCDGCNLELCLYVVVSSPSRAYPICPGCYNAERNSREGAGNDGEQENQQNTRSMPIGSWYSGNGLFAKHDSEGEPKKSSGCPRHPATLVLSLIIIQLSKQ